MKGNSVYLGSKNYKLGSTDSGRTLRMSRLQGEVRTKGFYGKRKGNNYMKRVKKFLSVLIS